MAKYVQVSCVLVRFDFVYLLTDLMCFCIVM